VFWIHLYAGLGVGLLLTAVGLSGSLLVFAPEIDRAIAPRPQTSSSGRQVSLAHVGRIAAKEYPNAQLTAIRYPSADTGAFEATLVHPDNHRTYVYVDPQTGAQLGTRDRNRVIRWFQDLHFYLLAGQTGLVVNGVGAGLLIVMCLSGLAVWWPGRTQWLRGFQVNSRASCKGLTYDLHRVAGIWSLLVLVMFGVTGVYFAFPDSFRRGLAAAIGDPTPLATPASQIGEAGHTLAWDAARARAAHLLPEGVETYFYPPTTPDAPFRLRKRLPGEFSESGRSYVYVDQYSGEILRVDDARSATLTSRLIAWIGPLHFGTIGSLAGRPGNLAVRGAWVVAGVVPGALFISGFLMWWNRVVVKARRRARERQVEPVGYTMPASVRVDI